MGTPDIDTSLYDLAKGDIDFGGIRMCWDFTDGLSREQWLEKRREKELGFMYKLKNGRLIIPSMNIY